MTSTEIIEAAPVAIREVAGNSSGRGKDWDKIPEAVKAERYGDRPEICGAVGWRALVELASTTTPEELREKFESRILAGERVNGAEIIRARGA